MVKEVKRKGVEGRQRGSEGEGVTGSGRVNKCEREGRQN